EIAIWAVRNHCLTGLKTELVAIELYRNDVRLERHQAGDTAYLRIGVRIGPCRETCTIDVVIAAQSFVRAEGLVLHGGQRRLIDVGAFNVPAWRETGLVQGYRAL